MEGHTEGKQNSPVNHRGGADSEQLVVHGVSLADEQRAGQPGSLGSDGQRAGQPVDHRGEASSEQLAVRGISQAGEQ